MGIRIYQWTRLLFNTMLSLLLSSMYEDHKVKCSSCGKLFVSKEHDTICDECSKKLENIKF